MAAAADDIAAATPADAADAYKMMLLRRFFHATAIAAITPPLPLPC